MKIAFVYDAVYPFVKGGAEKRVWELATRLTIRGHEVHLFGLKFWDGEQILVQDGVILHGVCPAEPLYITGRRSISEAFRFGFSVVRPLGKESFDVIDCQQFPYFSCFSARFVASVSRTPLVITWLEVWGDYWYEYLGWKGWFGRQTERMVARLSGRPIAISRRTAVRYEACFGKPAPDIIPIGIDTGTIRAIPPSKETSDVIFVGRLIKEKHVNLLIRAFSRLVSDQPDLKLVIVGEGPERDDLFHLITDLKLRDHIEFKRFLDSHDEIIGLMKSSRVFVIPSTREGFGITALEALACGIPVVTVNDPANAIRDLITPVTGFLCNLDEKDIAENINKALEMGEEMRDDCQKLAESFEWDQIVTEMEKLYLAVAGI
jgi:glycosyltransferase involved in cell wall biosynthesis